MAKSQPPEEFLQNLNESGLFTAAEMESLLAAPSWPPAVDGDGLAHYLIAAGKLSPFQAEAVRERRFDGLVIGNYQILDRIGAGGMGTVYKARHRRMRRVVAIKILTKTTGQSEHFIKRFQREVEAVARLSHPNIVMAHDADEAEVGHFLVMEFVNGRDLASEVRAVGPLPVREAVACILQAALALEYAHGQGIIHRDIKPANLLLDVTGVVKVADLGLARFDDAIGKPADDAGALTQAGAIMGTVDYMPPEQALGLTTIDHRADIYSLGCTLYFLLVGAPPYQGQTIMGTLLEHREAPIPSLTALRQDVPPELDALFRRMLAKSPADRIQTMTEVVRTLEAVLASLPEPAATSPADFTVGSEAASHSRAGDSGTQKTTLGAAPEPALQTVNLNPPSTVTRSVSKVLLVEPSRTQAGIIRRYLQAQGVQHVAVVASGQEALKTLPSESPDAIICALHLPDMTGIQLARQIRDERTSATPGFVLISSETESSEADSLSKCGRAILLQKPFTPEKLAEALRFVTSTPPSAPPATTDRGKLRVLIVDDSAAARLHMRSVLKSLGVNTFTEAADGAQAVAIVAGGTFDLIVTDYNMPFMDGRGLVGYLKQNPATASIPIIMVTTEQDPAKLEAVRQLGVSAVCDKTFPSAIVQKIIEQLV